MKVFCNNVITGVVAVFLAPNLVSAATQTPQTFEQLVAFIIGYINIIVPIVITLAVVYYMWNTAQGIWTNRTGTIDPDWQKGMVWGLLAIGLMVSIWGVLNILASTFGIPVTTR